MEIRKALSEDYSGISELAAANYVENLSSTDRHRGFLSATFTLQQIAAMARDLGIIVARDKQHVVGFICASRCDLNNQPSIVKRMVEAFDRCRFQGRALNDYKQFIYGPVCIDRAYRGRGLLRHLYHGLQRELAGKYDVGSAFVAEDNLHSLRAHVDGLGMSEVGRFVHGGRSYQILAFRVHG